MTKSEREKRKIAFMLVKFLYRFEQYDGDVMDIFEEAKDILNYEKNLSVNQIAEAERLIKNLMEYFQPYNYGTIINCIGELIMVPSDFLRSTT